MKVNVLGTEYEVVKKEYNADPSFKEKSCCGYCEANEHVIVYCDMSTYPDFEDETKGCARIEEKNILRHEIIHAFLSESGLNASSLNYGGAWARNEEMVDWIALQFPKMTEAFKKVGVLEPTAERDTERTLDGTVVW